MDAPIAKRFVDMSTTYPDQPALYCDERYFSYRELHDFVKTIQDTIAGNIPQQGCVIAIADELNEFTYAGILAISLSGNVVLPFKPDMAPERIEYIFNKVKPACVLYSHKVKDSILQQYPFLDKYAQVTLNEQGNEFSNTSGKLDLDTTYSNIAYILFTSGSTGKPKGVPVTRKNVNAFLDYYLDHNNYQFSTSDKFLQVYDFTFDVSYFSTLVPLSCGATCYALDNKPGKMKFLQIIKMLQDHDITVVSMVPTVLLFIKKYLHKVQLPKLKYSFFSGDILYQDIAVAWKKCFPNGELHNFYGPTETTIVCTRYIWNEEQAAKESRNNIVPLGVSFPGMEDLIINEEGKPVAKGEVGELCFHGTQVIDNYVDHEHEHMFINIEIDGVVKRFYRTGDLSSVNSYGTMLFHGRKDFQCKINGYRIEVPEVEKVLYEVVKSPVAVIAQRNVEGLNYLVACIEGDSVPEDAIKEEMLRYLPEYMLPSKFHSLSSMPLNSNQKIDKQFLLKNYF